jgi:succinate dehydrogenase/fumarate reductase cytochrome b subunit
MLAEWGTWRPRAAVARVVHRGLVVLVGAFMVGSMLFWSWLFFTGHWAS